MEFLVWINLMMMMKKNLHNFELKDQCQKELVKKIYSQKEYLSKKDQPNSNHK